MSMPVVNIFIIWSRCGPAGMLAVMVLVIVAKEFLGRHRLEVAVGLRRAVGGVSATLWACRLEAAETARAASRERENLFIGIVFSGWRTVLALVIAAGAMKAGHAEAANGNFDT